MTTIVTRAGKGSPLSNAEMDANLTNLNNDKLEGTVNISNGGTNATTASQAKINLGIVTSATGSQVIPSGTTAERDATPTTGYTRFNTTISALETYNGTIWENISSPSISTFQTLTASVASNELTITYGGGTLDFRNATLSNGTPISNVVVESNSITIPSTATLGTTSATPARLILLEAYNGGSPVLCIANLTGGLQLDETNLISPTTISISSDSSAIIYSASSVSADSPYRVVGFVDVTEATAGTWVTAPTLVQGIGGQAIASMSSLGFGQSWQSVTRTLGTTYYNTTGKPIVLVVHAPANNAGQWFVFTINSVSIATATGVGTSSTHVGGHIIIPAGAAYSFAVNTGTIGTLTARELR